MARAEALVAADSMTLGIEIDHLGLTDVAGVTQPVESAGGSTITNDEAFEIDGLVYPVGTQRLDGEHARTDMDATEMVRIGQRFRSGCTSEALEIARLEGDVAMPYDAPMQQELSFVRVDPLEVHSKVAWLQKARWLVDWRAQIPEK